LFYPLLRNENKTEILPKVTAVLQKTISQKESHPKPAVGLFSRVYSSKLLAEYTRCGKNSTLNT